MKVLKALPIVGLAGFALLGLVIAVVITKVNESAGSNLQWDGEWPFDDEDDEDDEGFSPGWSLF